MKTIFVNGCFDRLHIGHMRFLKWASECAEGALRVAVAPDYVCLRKGPERPIVPAAQRLEMVESIRHVSRAIIAEPQSMLLELRPGTYVKGFDQDLHDADAQCARELGWVIVQAPQLSEVSTTAANMDGEGWGYVATCLLCHSTCTGQAKPYSMFACPSCGASGSSIQIGTSCAS